MSDTQATMARAQALVKGAKRILVVTGAGVSASSGIPTFRGPEGLWKQYRPEELASPQAFAKDPALVWGWYDMRRQTMGACDPNAAHDAIAALQLARGEAVTLVTQNVDGLHTLALNRAQGHPDDAIPSEALTPLELHGNIYRVRCVGCGHIRGDRDPVDASSVKTLPTCGECGAMERPDVVWFGEPLPRAISEKAFKEAFEADLAVVIGTSALVHPAASIPVFTLRAGGSLIEVNPEPTPLSEMATLVLRMDAVSAVPALLAG